jgi:hypothetical protein
VQIQGNDLFEVLAYDVKSKTVVSMDLYGWIAPAQMPNNVTLFMKLYQVICVHPK